MQIPSTLASYEQPTLLIISSSEEARPFMIEGREVEELDKLATDATDYEYSDKEGFSYGGAKHAPGQGTVPGKVEKNDMHYERIFANYLVEKIASLDNQHTPAAIIITMPPNMEQLITEKLSQQLRAKLQTYAVNYINMSTPKILEALDKRR